MIPSSNSRLLIAEDWKKIYQSFKNADLKSYDFESLRRVMITYIRENYPEDFNDYIESSEFLALIDLIAYLGQNLSFRIDLNARENFIETAERRDSLIKLAKLVNYNVRRNIPASGLLRILAVSTTDNVIDSNGINLANNLIGWNDANNPEWYQQFVAIMNSAMIDINSFGKPSKSGVVNGIKTEQYRINSNNTGVPIYTFNKIINGLNLTFEIVPSTFNEMIDEETPKPRNAFSLLYRNDNQGNNSNNTGFFVLFKQGVLSTADFSVNNPVPNEIIGIDAPNINDTDIWLWQLNAQGTLAETLWSKVPSITGNNVIYNSISLKERNIYSVLSRTNDQVDLSFADGSFADLPKGNFRLYYRQSFGSNYIITPSQFSNISFEISYTNRIGQTHSLTVLASLNYTVNNASAAESDQSIRSKAPQVYYSQNRMITAEDYNIVPLIAGNDVVKVKAVNRISSGISKYFELSDVSGKYSDINIFASDGILYKEITNKQYEFVLGTRNELKKIFREVIAQIIKSNEVRSFYYDNYTRYSLATSGVQWVQGTSSTNQSTGYFEERTRPLSVGQFSSTYMKYVKIGSLIKFKAPMLYNAANSSGELEQTYFLPNGKLTFVEDSTTSLVKWSKVINVVGDGSNTGKGLLSTGIGPIVLSDVIPTEAEIDEILPRYVTNLENDLENELIDYCFNLNNFGITLNQETSEWNIIDQSNIDLTNNFTMLYQNDLTKLNKDASWLIGFEWTGKNYKLRFRSCQFIFESEKENAFYVDAGQPIYDYTVNTYIKDKVSILPINSLPFSNMPLAQTHEYQIDGSYLEDDGYINTKKVKVSFYDNDNNGLIDNIDSFNEIVDPFHKSNTTGFRDSFLIFQLRSDGIGYDKVDTTYWYFYPNESNVPADLLVNGQMFYFYDDSVNAVKQYSSSSLEFVYQNNYFARVGRAGLKFQYSHRADEARRIDPSKTNIIDLFLLTKSYDIDYRNWLTGGSGIEPLSPTPSALESIYGPSLEIYKAVSDEVVFHPVKYKVLFGSQAVTSLQATFKAVRNSASYVADTDIKNRIITAINNFFSIENWEFGQTFYFSELVTYVMNELTPDITNFVIVSKQNKAFGSLFEIVCAPNEIFISGASTSDIEVIDYITSNQLNASGSIVTSSGG